MDRRSRERDEEPREIRRDLLVLPDKVERVSPLSFRTLGSPPETSGLPSDMDEEQFLTMMSSGKFQTIHSGGDASFLEMAQQLSRHDRSRGERDKGAFWPQRPKPEPSKGPAYKASTVLTNLQRGNIPTMQTIVEPTIASVHQRAGQGELKAAELNAQTVNERDTSGKTPLLWAAAYGQTPTVQLLLKHGADVNAVASESETALHLAAAHGHHDVIRMLVSHGASVNCLDENACTPLMFAALQNHPHCVNELLVNRADISLVNINGDSAFSLAVSKKARQAQAVMENHLAGYFQGLMAKE